MNNDVMVPNTEAVIQKCCATSFGNRLVVNNLRSIVVEAIVNEMLPEWRWCAHDWAGWDFEHSDGHRLEVKQCAALQAWKSDKPPRPVYDIRGRTGYHDDRGWTAQKGRYAHAYLFGYHPGVTPEADHRDAWQWEFYLVASSALPNSRTISLQQVKLLTTAFQVTELPTRVREFRTNAQL